MESLKNKRVVLFDLDGTISDSAQGITASVAYALDKMGYPYESREQLRRFVGPPLREEFMAFCGLSQEEGDRAVDCYREYYTVKGMYDNTMYEGVSEMLEELKASGKALAVATSKPEKFARLILEGYGVSHFFDFIGGSELNGDRTDKAEVIAYTVCSLGCSFDECVMVGDRLHDIIGAKKHGIPAIGVLWGYGSAEELEESNATEIVDTPKELIEALT